MQNKKLFPRNFLIATENEPKEWQFVQVDVTSLSKFLSVRLFENSWQKL